jgi:hypothetical protein
MHVAICPATMRPFSAVDVKGKKIAWLEQLQNIVGSGIVFSTHRFYMDFCVRYFINFSIHLKTCTYKLSNYIHLVIHSFIYFIYSFSYKHIPTVDELLLYSHQRVSASEITLYTHTLMTFAPEYLQSIIDDFAPIIQSMEFTQAIKKFSLSLGLVKRKEIEDKYLSEQKNKK